MNMSAGNLSKCGWVDGPRDGSSWSRRTVMYSVIPYLMKFFLLLSSFSLDGKYERPSQAQRSVEGLRSKTLQLLESGYWDHFSELHDQPAGLIVIATMDRHKLRNPTLGKTSPSSFSSCTTLPPTDRRKHDGPS